MSFLFSEFGAWIVGIGLTALGVIIAYAKGRMTGKKLEQADRDKDRLKAIHERKETDDEVDALDSKSVRSRLDRWLRDNG